MKAINSVVKDTGDFIGAFRENVIRIIEENAKLGAVTEDFDHEYKKGYQRK